MMWRVLTMSLVLLGAVCGAVAQDAKPAVDKPRPDVLVFTNGDRMTGKLERIAGGKAVFASDMAGEISVSLNKVKEIETSGTFALLRKGEGTPRTPVAQPEGHVVIADGAVSVSEAGVSTSVAKDADVDYLVDSKTYDQQMLKKAKFFEGWTGTVTGGATLVRSTTSGTTLTAATTLVRAVPSVGWLAPRNRTLVNMNESYGRQSSPQIPPVTLPNGQLEGPTVVQTSIFHADAERDEYFTPRLYALGDVAFDHNFAQGLQLQQIFGGGLGMTVFKRPKQELDVKADVHYERQQFITTPVNGAVAQTTPSADIIGATIFEGYHYNLPRSVVFTETANILPAFNDTKAYSANVMAAVSAPVFKRLSATISATDNYLNDPAPYYRKNALQFVTGLTYNLK